MKDFARSKSKLKKSKKKRRLRTKTQTKTQSKTRTSKFKTAGKKSLWQVLECFAKRLANFTAIAAIILFGFYFSLEPIINHFYPLKKTENILLVFINQANSDVSFYFFSTKASEKQFSLGLVKFPPQDLELKTLNALQWSGKLKVMVDRVERFEFFSDDDSRFYGSLQKMRKLFFFLIKNELKDQSSSTSSKWQRIKQLVQWRAVLTNYKFLGGISSHTGSDNNAGKASQEVSLAELPSLVLSQDSQDCSLGVLNATAIPGLASQTSTILEQAGFLILRISNADRDEHADNKLAITQLAVKQNLSDNCQETQNRLLNWLPESTTQINDEQLLNRYRNDLILILGEDVAASLLPQGLFRDLGY